MASEGASSEGRSNSSETGGFPGSGFRGFRVQGLGFRACLGFPGSGFMFRGLGSEKGGFWLRVYRGSRV